MKNLSNIQNSREMVISFMIIRRAVGILGVALPVLLALGTMLIGGRGCRCIEPSISNYYYTIMGNVLVGVLCAVSLFLFTYRGFDKKDNISSSFAGLFALGIAFFPMNIESSKDDCDILTRCDNTWRNGVHYGSAALFFITLAYISYCLFTKTHHADKNQPMTANKKKRNIIYRVCAIIMIASIAVIGSLLIPEVGKKLSPYKLTIIFETIALWAFGLSWLTKGEFLLKDR